MNLPNYITLYRGLGAFLFMILMSLDNIVCKYLAIIVFITSAVSDLYDGRIARKTGNITNFGKTIDPLADKLLITGGLVILVQESVIPAWMAIIIISREFIVMGLRILASSDNKIIVSNTLGKYKTIAQLIAIIISLVFILFKNTFMLINKNPIEEILKSEGVLGKYVALLLNLTPYFFILIAVIISVISAINYIIQNKNVILKEM